MDKKINNNSIYNFIKTFSQFIFPLITFPYISRVLGVTNIGKINFSNSIVSYMSLIATLGINSYAIRECSKVKEDRNKFSLVASEILSINLVTTAVSYLVLILLLLFSKNLYSYRLLIIILSTTIIFNTLGADWINIAIEDFKFITIRSLIFQIISLLLMFIFVKEENDYIKYAVISLISTSGANIINIFYRKKICRIKLFKRISWKKHFKPIFYMFVLYVSQQIYVNSDITILGIFKGDDAVGIYSTSVKIYNIVNAMICSVCTVVVPKASLYFAKKNYYKISEIFNYALKFIVVIGIPAIVGLNMLSKELIMLLAGDRYISATPSLHILSIALIFSLLGGLIGNVTMIPAGREKVCFYQGIIAAALNIILNIIFIPFYGIIAAAATTAISEAVSFIIMVIKMDKKIKMDKMKNIIFAPIMGSIIVGIIIILCKILIKNLYINVFVSVALSVVSYFTMLYLLKDKFVKNLLNKK